MIKDKLTVINDILQNCQISGLNLEVFGMNLSLELYQDIQGRFYTLRLIHFNTLKMNVLDNAYDPSFVVCEGNLQRYLVNGGQSTQFHLSIDGDLSIDVRSLDYYYEEKE